MPEYICTAVSLETIEAMSKFLNGGSVSVKDMVLVMKAMLNINKES